MLILPLQIMNVGTYSYIYVVQVAYASLFNEIPLEYLCPLKSEGMLIAYTRVLCVAALMNTRKIIFMTRVFKTITISGETVGFKIEI